MSTNPEGSSLVLTDALAREWYMTRRGGGHLLDAHLTAIDARFGPDVNYHFRAPIDPITGRPTLLIIEVDLPMSQDESWDTLDAVESDLLAQREDLREISRRRDPFANIAITLAVRTQDWPIIRQAIEEMT